MQLSQGYEEYNEHIETVLLADHVQTLLSTQISSNFGT